MNRNRYRKKQNRTFKKQYDQEALASGLQQLTSNQVLDDFDAMMLAKHFPGQYDVPFVQGMNLTSAHHGIIKAAFPLSSTREGVDIVPLGQYKYTLLSYCPILSAYYTNNTYTTKCSGFQRCQVNSTTTNALNLQDFWGTESGSLSELYGSQGTTIAENVAIWASEMKIKLEGPNATRTGVVHIGHFPISSIYDKTNGATAALSITDLMKCVNRTIDLKRVTSFSLKSAIVDHDLVSTQRKDISSDLGELGGEIISFAIIENPFVLISGSGTVPWTLSATVYSNYCFYPRIYDAFARNISEKAGTVESKLLQDKSGYDETVAGGRQEAVSKLQKVATEMAVQVSKNVLEKVAKDTMGNAATSVLKEVMAGPNGHRKSAFVDIQGSGRMLNSKNYSKKAANADRKLNGKFRFGGAFRPYAPIYVDIKARDARGRAMAVRNHQSSTVQIQNSLASNPMLQSKPLKAAPDYVSAATEAGNLYQALNLLSNSALKERYDLHQISLDLEQLQQIREEHDFFPYSWMNPVSANNSARAQGPQNISRPSSTATTRQSH